MINRILKVPLIVWHRWIAPILPPSCRFYPSCSVYAMQALDHYPLHRALPLILRRLSHCHPFHPGGYDPLPLDDPGSDEPNPNEKAGPR